MYGQKMVAEFGLRENGAALDQYPQRHGGLGAANDRKGDLSHPDPLQKRTGLKTLPGRWRSAKLGG
jgi:hypothetical protein